MRKCLHLHIYIKPLLVFAGALENLVCSVEEHEKLEKRAGWILKETDMTCREHILQWQDRRLADEKKIEKIKKAPSTWEGGADEISREAKAYVLSSYL